MNHYGMGSMRRWAAPLALAMGVAAMGAAPAGAQEDNRVLEPNYGQAEKFTSGYLRQFVYSTSVTPNWIHDTDFFWYSYRDSEGWRYHLVNPVERVNLALFDRVKMASELSKSLKTPIDTSASLSATPSIPRLSA